jgi:CNT family concentrative nucleoside transporter
MERLISFCGLFVMIGLAWLMSSHKRIFPWRVVIGGTILQFAAALWILKTDSGKVTFDALGQFFQTVVNCTTEGASFVFDINGQESDPELPPKYSLLRTFAFGVLPTIVFFSSLMAVLYYLGVMQRIVQLFAWVMQKTLGTSGAETLSAAANIFVGQTEAPLVVRPYVREMTMSELNAVMVGGFATIAGGVLAMFVSIGLNPVHLMTASVISAPAALLIAKVMYPETEHSKTAGRVEVAVPSESANVIEAAAEGASTGMQLAINVAAMLIAFVAMVALIDLGFGMVGGWFGFEGDSAWTLKRMFAAIFSPLAWTMGIPWEDCPEAGSLFGTRMVLNEVIAYLDLDAAVKAGEITNERSAAIIMYGLCGFSNFSSIGIQIGGIGAMAPERRGDLARLGLRAMLGGTLASFMTACVAGVLL